MRGPTAPREGEAKLQNFLVEVLDQPVDDEGMREMVRTLQSKEQSAMRAVLLALAEGCRGGHPHAKANRGALMKAGGVSALVDMLVDATTTIGQLGPKGVDKHAFTQLIVQVLRDLAEQGADDDDASAVHAQMIFVGLPEWLAEYLQAAAAAKRASGGLISLAGRIPKPQPQWGAVWSGNSRGTSQFVTAAMAQQLVLMLAASASGIEGLLHAGLAQVLAEEIETAPPELTGAVLAAAAMVLKYHHECTGAVEAARAASVGGKGYSKLVDAAGIALQNEVAALVEDIKGGPKENDYTAAAEELVRLSLFSDIFVETVAMKLLPALNGMIHSDHAELVSRASKVVAVVSEDSPDLATLLCSSGLLETVVRCLTPMLRFQNSMVSHHSAQDAFVSPRTRLYLLEILSTISLPTAPKSPYSILLRSISNWPAVSTEGQEQAHGPPAKMSLSDLLDDLTKAFRVEAERPQLALGPLSHFVTVMSFMVLEPNVRNSIAERADLLELLLAHSCINTLGVLAVVTVLDTETNGDSREGAMWALRRIPSLDCAIEEDPSVSFQIAFGLGFLVSQPDFVAYVLGMELVPVLLSFLEDQQGSEFVKTRRESVRVLTEILQDKSLRWDSELEELRNEVEKAVAKTGFLADECDDSCEERARTQLPDGWEERKSATTGECYFFNVTTAESQWEAPRSASVDPKVREGHLDVVELEGARDVSSSETESEDAEAAGRMTGEKSTEREVTAALQTPMKQNCVSNADVRKVVAVAPGDQTQQQGHNNLLDSQKAVAAAKRAQRAAEAETDQVKHELASLRQEWQVQKAAEADKAKVMAEEVAVATRAQRAAEAEAARLVGELDAVKKAQHAAEAETARIQNAEAQSLGHGSSRSDSTASTGVVIALEFAEDGPLGISFIEGDSDDRPIIVDHVRAGSAAARTEQVEEGMQLVSVNHVGLSKAESTESVLDTIKTSARPIWLGLSRPVSKTLADEGAAVVPLHKYQQLQQLVASLEQRITGLEAPSLDNAATSVEDSTVESQQDGMPLHDFLSRYHLESFESRLQELGVVVPEHLCDVDEADLESMGMKRLEIVRFSTACDLLGELDDL